MQTNWCVVLLCMMSLTGTHAAVADPIPVIPGQSGFGMHTPAGRGGQVIVVSTLAANGAGSLREAVETAGPRTILFEVGGVIDLQGESLTLIEPFVTIAGQSAPSPGITLIRGGLNVFTHDALIQHIAIRPGDNHQPQRSGWAPDGINLGNAFNIVIDHCSVTWAVDENISASGPRHEGRENTSRQITIAHCIIAEGLRNASHEEGAHSMGTLIHDHVRDVAIIGNLYASNVNRNPVLKPDASAAIVNNLIFNPGNKAIHTYWAWHEYIGRSHELLPCELAVVGNVLQAGADTPASAQLLSIEQGQARVYSADNLSLPIGNSKPQRLRPNWTALDEPPVWPTGLQARPASEVAKWVLSNAGARPADRDLIDRRIVIGAGEKSGAIIDSQEDVGGYPTHAEAHHTLKLPDHPHADDDHNGYTNLEEWLHELARQVETPADSQ